eukprot:gene4097-7385_t
MKQITEETADELRSSKKPIFVLFTNKSEDIQMIEKISKKYTKKFNFYFSTETNLSGLALAENLGLQEFPNISIFNSNMKKKFHFNRIISKKSVYKFIQNYQNNKLKPFKKSKVRPKNDRDEYFPTITEVVASSFEEIVLQSQKDVFLLVYAEWNDISMNYIPLFSIVSQLFELIKEDSIIISMINFDENDLHNEFFNIEEKIPILKYFKKNDKNNPISYQSFDKFEYLIDFICQHSSETLNLEEINKNYPIILNKHEKLINGNVITISSNEEIEKLKSTFDKLIILYFHSTLSDSCKFINPFYSKESMKYPKSKFLKIDSDKHQKLSEKYEISSIPCFIFIFNGTEVDRLEGVNESEFSKIMRNY